MYTIKQQMHKIVIEYQNAGQKWPASTAEISNWAVKTNRYDLTRPTLERHCAKELAKAMRNDYFIDAKGRRVRAKHPAKVTKNGKQFTLWDDIRTAPREHMEKAFQSRRQRITHECKQVKTDVDSYNDEHLEEPPIQMVLDFTQDVKELELADIDKPISKNNDLFAESILQPLETK